MADSLTAATPCTDHHFLRISNSHLTHIGSPGRQQRAAKKAEGWGIVIAIMCGHQGVASATSPRASLVIPVYRGWDFADALLRSVSPVPAWLEVVVVDDASGDGGGFGFARKWPSVRLLDRKENGGFAAAVNLGVSAALGTVVVVANSDIETTVVDLDKLVAHAEQNKWTIFAPRTFRRNGYEIKIGYKFPTVLSLCGELFIPIRFSRAVKSRLRSRSAPVIGITQHDWVVGSCLAFSRSVWGRVGELDTKFGMYSEEVDWQRRAADLGVNAAVVSDARVMHDESHGLLRASNQAERRFRAGWRARMLYADRWCGTDAVRRLKILWLLADALGTPIWMVLELLPPFRADASSERRKLALLRRAALGREIL